MTDGNLKSDKEIENVVALLFIIPVEKSLEQLEMMTENNKQDQRWWQESDKQSNTRVTQDNWRMKQSEMKRQALADGLSKSDIA